jgi:hypothetical protein
MADDDADGAAAAELQRATFADVTDKLSKGASAEEAATLCASLADLIEEYGRT